jgi:hypothetical protein
MEVELMCTKVEYCDDQKFQSHNLTSSPRIFEVFPDNLPKMQDTENINWSMHLEFDWEYFTSTSKKWGNILAFTSTFH